MKEIVIPQKLIPIVKAFYSDNQSAKLLIREAVKSICKTGSMDYGFDEYEQSDEEIEGIIALMQGIAPQDTLETIYAAQLISSHIMGLCLLSHGFQVDQTLGLKLLKFSNEAMIKLQKKRSAGVSHNINVAY